uniref:Retrotransposon gag protein n=1 Tax=Solanum tuberosum TaxID=4113 RepID=M1B792_SOLTU
MHRLAWLGDRQMDSTEGGVVVMNRAEFSLVSEVKEKQDENPILLELKASVHKQKVMSFEQGGDSVLRQLEIYARVFGERTLEEKRGERGKFVILEGLAWGFRQGVIPTRYLYIEISSVQLSQVSSSVPFELMSCFRIPLAYSYILCTDASWPASSYDANTVVRMIGVLSRHPSKFRGFTDRTQVTRISIQRLVDPVEHLETIVEYLVAPLTMREGDTEENNSRALATPSTQFRCVNGRSGESIQLDAAFLDAVLVPRSEGKTKTLGILNLTALSSGRTAIDPGPMRKGLNSYLP